MPAASQPITNLNRYLPLRGSLPCVLKRQDGASEIAARDTRVALLNQLLCGCDLLGVYIRYDRLVDCDLCQLACGIDEWRDNRRHRRRIVDWSS